MAEKDYEETDLRMNQDGHTMVNIDDGRDNPEESNANSFREANDLQKNESLPSRADQTGIHHAAKVGKDEELHKILETYPDFVGSVDEKGQTPLHLAAGGLHLKCCQALLSISNKEINLKDNSGYTPLLVSISSGDISYEVTKLLIEKSGNLKITTKSKQTAVHIAAEKGNAKTLKLLLDRDRSNLNSEDNAKTTPLHLASKNGHVLVCEELINMNANNDAKDQKGYTPLHWAARKGFHACMKLLISSGCQVDAVDTQGNTPFHIYCKHTKNRPECIKLLLDANANPNARNQSGKTPFHLAQSLPFDIRKAFEGSVIDLLVTDNKGKTALHYAAKKGYSSKHVDFILKMGKNTTDMSHFINIRDAEGHTALHIAANRGELDTCRSLIRNGADINVPNERKDTALHMAAENGRRQVIELLIDKRAAVNSMNIDSLNALHMAVKKGHDESCEVLMKKCANVRESDPEGNSILHMAVKGKHISCINTILRLHPALVYLKNKDKKTPMHIAVEKRYIGCCKALLNVEKIDLWTETKETLSPVRLAYEKQFFDVFHLLLMDCKINNEHQKFQDIDFRKLLKVALQNSNSQVVQSITASVYWEESLQPYYVPHESTLPNSQREKLQETTNLNLSNIVKDYDKLAEQIFDKCMPLPRVISESEEGNADPDHDEDYFKIKYLDEIIQQKGEQQTQGEGEECALPSPYCPTSPPEAFDPESGKLKEGVKTNTVNLEWRQQHVLALAVRRKHQRLLGHPLVKRWVQFKWDIYICYWFYISAAFATGHAVLLTVFAAISWDWRAMYDKYELNQTDICAFNYSLVGPEVADKLKKEAQAPNGISYALYVIMVFWFIINIYKITKFQELRRKIILSSLCITTDFVFLYNFTKCSQNTYVREDWQWIFGPLAVAFAWILAYSSCSRYPFFNLKFFSFKIFISAAKDIILPLSVPSLIGFIFYILTSKGSLTLMLNMNWLFTFFQGMPSIGTLLMMVMVAIVFLARIRSDEEDHDKEREFERTADAINLILDFDLLFPWIRRRFYVSKIPAGTKKKTKFCGSKKYLPVKAF